MTDATNMQPESQSGVANSTPQQDTSRSYPSEQTAEYPRQNHRARGTPNPLSQNDSQSENEVEDPRPIETATTNMQSGSPSGAENDTPPQDEPQSYPTSQIAKYLTWEPVTNEQCIPIFSLSSDTQEEEENAICSNGFPGLNPGCSHRFRRPC